MRFGIHNLLREKVEEFSDDEENIEVEETDIEDHEEEEEEEDDEGMEEEKRGKAHIAPELSETKKNVKQEEVRNDILKDRRVRCFFNIYSFLSYSEYSKQKKSLRISASILVIKISCFINVERLECKKHLALYSHFVRFSISWFFFL